VATHRSALKAHRQSLKRRERNRRYRTRLRHALKAIRAAIAAGQREQATAALSETFSLIDRLASKGIIHRNTAARYKSRIARRLAGASARP
jgi:small subunit ribosomal protein S20